MNATAQKVKGLIIEHLREYFEGEELSVVDAKAITQIELPLIAVDIVSSEAHSPALPQVYNLAVDITLRDHAGDQSASADGWKDSIESLTNDASGMMAIIQDQGVIPFQWLYAGSVEEWNENIVETRFSSSLICGRA